MAGKPKQCVSVEQVRKAQTVFAEMAKTSKLLTLKQALEELRPMILPLFEQGYSHQDVVEVLHQLDMQISLTTLRQILKENAKEAAVKQEKPIVTAPARGQAAPPIPPPEVVSPDEAINLDAIEIDVDAAIAAIAEADEYEPKQPPLTETLTQQTALPAAQTFTKRITVAAIPVERTAASNTASNAARDGEDEAEIHPAAKPERPKAMLPLATPSVGRTQAPT